MRYDVETTSAETWSAMEALVDAKLARDHDAIAHYNGRVLQETAAAAEDDRFDWIGAHHRGSPVSCARDVG